MKIVATFVIYAFLIYMQGQKLVRERRMRDATIMAVLYLLSLIPFIMLQLQMDVPPVNTMVRVLVKRLLMR